MDSETDRQNVAEHLSEPLPECPDCESTDASLDEREQRFLYGRGQDAVELTCSVPVYTCSHCGCQWSGGDAEDARQEAVCRHLGRLTPREVRRIRDGYGLSQAEFSRITGLGEASLSRWETGAGIQNTACDRLLRLIAADAGILGRLREIVDARRTDGPRFQVLAPTPEMLKRQQSFQLRYAS